MASVKQPKTANLWRYQAKRWKLREINAEGEEDGEGWIDQTPKGFEWMVERWIADGKGSATPKRQDGVAATFGQARDLVLGFFRVPRSRLKYLSGTSNKILTAAEVEPAEKQLVGSLKKAKSTFAAAAKKAKKPAKKKGKSTWAKIRALVMPSSRRKKGRRRR